MSYFQNVSLRNKLYDYIKQKINSGELKPGEPINQKEIFDELKISRTPYRDCMIQLETEGLVDIIPCRGVVVRELSLEEVMEYQEIGAALEGMAYQLAYYNARKCVPKLTKLVEEAEACFKNNEPVFQDKNMEFHILITEQCPNDSLVEQLIKLRDRLYDFPRKDPVPITKWEKIFWQEHRRQIEILKNGTPEEFGAFTRNVHWNVKGKEGYWDTLLSLKPGTVKRYFETRDAFAESSKRKKQSF